MPQVIVVPLFLLFSILFTSCKSLEEYYNRDKNVHQRIMSLELGMTKQRVLDIVQYQPDFVNKEAFSDGMREILVYRGSHSPLGWMGETIPTVYRLVLENGRLVVVDADKDYEQVRINEQHRIEQARKEAEDRRTAALIEAQKKKEEESKKSK